MDHIAIMRKSWKLTDKVLSGEKTIESRWYVTRRAPWNVITAGDTVFFMDSGSPVRAKGTVKKVLQIEITPAETKRILNTHGKEIGIEKKDIPFFYDMFKNKNYCILIFLKNVQAVTPFSINKKGFGNMAAWLSVDDVKKLMC